MDIRIVDGNLVKDAEVKTNATTGAKYLSFTLANNGFAKGQKTTTYFNVVSYDNYLIKRQETENFYTKGRLVVVTGKPNENMVVKDGQTYLNRNIVANSVELGTFVRNENQSQNNGNNVSVYRDVAPAPPVCETPKVQAPQPQVATPIVAVAPRTEVPVQAPTPAYTVETPVAPQAVTNVPNVEDDLPF